jgi:corrinoid protein of di/trimethylamine methyltransferase
MVIFLSEEILSNVRKAILDFDAKQAESWTMKAVEKHIDLIKVADALTEAVRLVGEGYARGEYFLPDLVMAGDAMRNAMRVIEAELRKTGKSFETLGVIVIGTVAGDIHDIGKTLVATLLASAGFQVIDLGVDINAGRFVESVKTYKPHILAMSALLTSTAPEQKKVMNLLMNESLRNKVKVLVGGGAITKEFATEIGADGFAATAPEAVREAKKMLNIQ